MTAPYKPVFRYWRWWVTALLLFPMGLVIAATPEVAGHVWEPLTFLGLGFLSYFLWKPWQRSADRRKTRKEIEKRWRGKYADGVVIPRPPTEQ